MRWEMQRSHVARRLSAAVLLVAVLLGPAATRLPAQQQHPAMAPADVRAALEQRGIQHRLSIVETDGERVQGTLVSIRDSDAGVMTDAGVPTDIQFSQIYRVRGHGLTRGQRTAVITVTAVVAVALLSILAGGGFRD